MEKLNRIRRTPETIGYVPLPVPARLMERVQQWDRQYPWWKEWGARRIAEGRAVREAGLCNYCDPPEYQYLHDWWKAKNEQIIREAGLPTY